MLQMAHTLVEEMGKYGVGLSLGVIAWFMVK